ncbi:hypothetical protein EG327_004957 [Venturia inaequalis]|uniref:Glucosidase 2 subunit beta n=1 Tax=Venturia inaequalis TaxID=5025 RepID=A0A8H3ZEP5_VENIN|nr:hypothetical protein EG327_004957 [Venturia inaequalis]
MKAVIAATLALAAASRGLAVSDVPRPRGVGPEFSKHYKATDSFKCINNPDISLELSQVNDDYCDCPDGSDEPGTSACSHLNDSFAIPGFYCKNKGHTPTYVPFTHVNDGVCDYDLCCDGSDEWEGIGDKCPDKCKEIGQEWRKQNELRQKALGAATKKRKELVTEAGRLKKEVEDRIQTLKTQITSVEIKVQNLEREFAETEKREKARVVRAPKEGGKMGVLVTLAKQRTEELRTNLERVVKERNDAQSRLKELESMLTTFKEEYNPNFNDEGVKRAVRAWEDYAARDKPAEDLAIERDLNEVLKEDSENGLTWTDYENEESGADLLYKFEEYLPEPVRNWVDQKLRDLRVILIDNGILADASAQGEESKAVQDARSRLDGARSELNDDKESLKKHEEDLTGDYGPDDVFRALKGKCVSVDSGEYEYEMCWMGGTTQKPKKGGGHVAMGTYTHLKTIFVDEDLPANGKGLGSGERLAMMFENGQHCWNGPARQTTVIMACAEKDEIWKVVEAEKCMYKMEIGTPAVCTDNIGKAAQKGKDEL